MGCCCSSRKAEIDRGPIYVYYPQTLGYDHFSSTNGPSSAVSAGVLVDTNLDTSSPDTYRAPPPPLPYDVGLPASQTLPEGFENCGNKTDHMRPTDSQLMAETVDHAPSEGFNSESLEVSDCKSKYDDGSKPVKETKDLAVDEEVACPICLEGGPEFHSHNRVLSEVAKQIGTRCYNIENPQIITKCEHHFHLACILEWMERSDTCPVCDQIMVFDPTLYE